MANEVLVIKGSEWLRGSRLKSGLRVGDQFCCMGLDARRVGVPVERIDGGFPTAIYDVSPPEYRARWVRPINIPGETRHGNTGDAVDAACANDNLTTTDDQKIEALRPIFAKHGIAIDWRPLE